MAKEYRKFTRGDDILVPIQLMDGEEEFPVDEAATVRAALWHNSSKVLVGPVTLDPDDPAADWTTGLLAIRFPAGLSIGLQPGPTTLEIEIDDNGKRTEYVDCITIVAGQIT